MGRDAWVPVTVPVEAKVGKVTLRLFPYELVPLGGDSATEMPWAWGALCRVTFRFGDRVTTKRVRAKYVYHDARGWPARERPSDAAREYGRATVLAMLRDAIADHGIDPPPFVVEGREAEPAATALPA